MKYVIGIDSGGTKTEAVAYDLKGNIIISNLTGFGNLLVDYTKGLANIQNSINMIFTELPQKNCELIVLGLAGIDSGNMRSKLHKDLVVGETAIEFMNDGQLAHISLLRGSEGILLIAGTGSLALGMKDNKWFRVGGWGHLLGDEGSAYSIAIKAIQHVLKQEDEGMVFDYFSNFLLKNLEVNNVFEMTAKVYKMTKGDVANIAKLVSEISDKSIIAKSILIQTADEITATCLTILKKMDLKTSHGNSPIQIAINGSVIEKNSTIKNKVIANLNDSKVNFQMITSEESRSKAAYYVYEKRKNK